MLCYLNRGQTRYRRTLSALLAVLWLNLIALPCVMAQPFSAAGEDCLSCPAEDDAAQASAMDCASAQHCAVMLDEQSGTLAKALPYAMTPPVMQPLWAYAVPGQRTVFYPPSFSPTFTPLERLPILRI
ncbi:MAG: hypothetical protein C4528_02500 [Gammaproteobacteria bacterium]|nr:MAG: hypothetical protein C4528_02500 [Gammaproteobacteria bacterium]